MDGFWQLWGSLTNDLSNNTSSVTKQLVGIKIEQVCSFKFFGFRFFFGLTTVSYIKVSVSDSASPFKSEDNITLLSGYGFTFLSFSIAETFILSGRDSSTIVVLSSLSFITVTCACYFHGLWFCSTHITLLQRLHSILDTFSTFTMEW